MWLYKPSTPLHALMFGAISLFAVLPARGQTVIYVDSSSTGPEHDGSTWCTAFVDPQDALAVASSGVEIRVANGTYAPDRGTGDRTATFRLVNGVTLSGGYAGCGAADPDLRDIAGLMSVFSGDLNGDDGPDFSNRIDNCFHVVTNDDPAATTTTVLDGFTIRGGHADGTLADRRDQGGGLHNFNGVNPFTGKALVRNCTFTDNWAANHGAVNDHGGLTLVNCEFRNNFAGMWGGGLYIHGGLPTTVTDCRFLDNRTDGTAGGGAGATNESNTLFTNCLFARNTSATNGGGIYIHDGGAPTLISCTFSENEAENGGAIYNTEGSRPIIQDCILTDNSAANSGGGIYNTDGSAPTIRGCRLERNAANGTISLGDASGGGGVYNQLAAAPLLANCLFAENTAVQRGAGMYSVSSSAPTMFNCEFRANVAGIVGGAMASYSLSAPTLVNCVFNGNRALGDGGGLWNGQGADPTFINCVITGNRGQSTGGIFHINGTLTIVNSIVWKNWNSPFQETEIIQLRVTGGGTVDMDYTALQGWTGGFGGVANNGSDPLFVDPDGIDGVVGTADDNLRLASSSPAIGTGDNSALPPDIADLDEDGVTGEPVPRDLAGSPRLFGVVDRGPFEQPDCNLNGILDSQDISSGISQDCDVNGVPDECESPADCNANGVRDLCDIAAGNGDDCDQDGVLDECQPESDCNHNEVHDLCDIGAGTSQDCDGDSLPDECGPDCNANGRADVCDLADGMAQDCNSNTVPDSCEIAQGTSDDVNGNGVPDECDTLLPPFITEQPLGRTVCVGETVELHVGTGGLMPQSFQWRKDGDDIPGETSDTLTIEDAAVTDTGIYDVMASNAVGNITSQPAALTVSAEPVTLATDPTGINKCRYISFAPPTLSCTSAIKVTLLQLHRPIPPSPGGGPDFAAFEGQTRWVGPPAQYLESTSDSTPFYSSVLQCTPHYQDWSSAGLLHVTGSAVVPSSLYEIQLLNADCTGNEESCSAVSAPIQVETTRWADLDAPFSPPSPTTQPDIDDISALVDKFKSADGAPIKARALLAGVDAFGTINAIPDTSFEHISACVDAFKGEAYPYAIAECP